MTKDDQLESLKAIETDLQDMAANNPELSSRLYMAASRLQYQRDMVSDLFTQIEQLKTHNRDMANERERMK